VPLPDLTKAIAEARPMGTTRSIYIVAHQFAKALDADNFKKNSEEHCGYFCLIAATTWSALNDDFPVASKSVRYCRLKPERPGCLEDRYFPCVRQRQ